MQNQEMIYRMCILKCGEPSNVRSISLHKSTCTIMHVLEWKFIQKCKSGFWVNAEIEITLTQ